RDAHHRCIPVSAAASAGSPSPAQAPVRTDQELPTVADDGNPAVRLPPGWLDIAIGLAAHWLAVSRQPVRTASGSQDAALGGCLDRFRPAAVGSPPSRLARLQSHSLDASGLLPADARLLRQQAGSRIYPAYLKAIAANLPPIRLEILQADRRMQARALAIQPVTAEYRLPLPPATPSHGQPRWTHHAPGQRPCAAGH